jgi:hypothetical protein
MKIRSSHRYIFQNLAVYEIIMKNSADPDKSWVIVRNIAEEDSICMPGN